MAEKNIPSQDGKTILHRGCSMEKSTMISAGNYVVSRHFSDRGHSKQNLLAAMISQKLDEHNHLPAKENVKYTCEAGLSELAPKGAIE
jgi:hypothetical protein